MAATITTQVVANAIMTLNRINTLPTSNLTTIFDTIALGYVDAISIIEETQGQINENVTLARFMSVLTETQLQGNELITLSQSIGTGSTTLATVGEPITLEEFLAITMSETTQGQTEESVTLARVMGISLQSQFVGGEAINLNLLHGLASSSRITADGIFTLNSSHGITVAEESKINAAISLTRSNNISLTTNVVALDDVSLLKLLLILADPSATYSIENASRSNAVFIRFRDKRYPVIFRDKRYPVLFRDKRTKGES
jgi:hypothetical protein